MAVKLDTRQTAQNYVHGQVGSFSRSVPQKDVMSAVRQVQRTLDEIRTARSKAHGSHADMISPRSQM